MNLELLGKTKGGRQFLENYEKDLFELKIPTLGCAYKVVDTPAPRRDLAFRSQRERTAPPVDQVVSERTTVVDPEGEKATAEYVAKLHLNIDREVFANSKAVDALSRLQKRIVLGVYDRLLSESGIIERGKEEGLSGWGWVDDLAIKFAKKAYNYNDFPPEIQAEMDKAINIIATSAANTIKDIARIVTFPARAAVTGALNLLKNKLGPAFLYSFIKDDSKYLGTNPEVDRKKGAQSNAIKIIQDALLFKDGYIEKHLRNGIINKHGVTPEKMIHDVAEGRSALAGLGSPELLAALLALAPVVPSLLDAFKPSEDIPKQSDWQDVPAPEENLSGDPDYEPEGWFTRFITSPVGIATGVGVLAVAGGVTYSIVKSSNKKSKKK